MKSTLVKSSLAVVAVAQDFTFFSQIMKFYNSDTFVEATEDNYAAL